MIWTELTEGIAEALRSAGLHTPERIARLELVVPREAAHGDWSTNLPLLLAKEVGRPPRAIAEAIAAAYPVRDDSIAAVEVAGPGFLNFRYGDAFLRALPSRILREGDGFGGSALAGASATLVEYVSANPTGPLNVVNARAAAVGAALVRLLRATGHRADGEFYVNDAGNQVEVLGQSMASRFAESQGIDRPFPEEGYRGEYVRDLARELPVAEARSHLDAADGLAWFRDQALSHMLAWQKRDLGDYGAEFAIWFRESGLHASGAVQETLEQLRARGVTYRADEAEWLRTTDFGDDKDRVIVRRNGVPTYLLPDIAYHRDKRARGWRHAIDLWGPDHHGHILPLRASLGALGLEPDFLEVILVQQVNLLSEGQPVKMSKRGGEFITLRELMDEVGPDCAKFFFLLRSTSAHLDFDLDLAKRQNDENPAFYVQYAHARICSVLRFAAEKGALPSTAVATSSPAPEERALVRLLATFPEVVRGAADAREPHRVPAYLMELSAAFHRFYHACRVVTEDRTLTGDRLQLCAAARRVLANGLALLGVSAPERMERAAEATA